MARIDNGKISEPLADTTGGRVKQLRGMRQLSTSELAKKAGVCRQTIWRIERGDENVGMRVIVNIADALGVKVSDLVGVDVGYRGLSASEAKARKMEALLSLYDTLSGEHKKEAARKIEIHEQLEDLGSDDAF